MVIKVEYIDFGPLYVSLCANENSKLIFVQHRSAARFSMEPLRSEMFSKNNHIVHKGAGGFTFWDYGAP